MSHAKPLWSEIDGEPWLDNPRRRKGRKSRKGRRRRPPKGFKSWKSYMASIRGKRRKGGSVARRKGRRSRRGRRSFRRNPPQRFSARGVVNTLTRGVQDAAFVVVGKAGARLAPALLGLPQGGMLGIAVQALSAVGVGMLVHRFAGGDAGRFAVAGALSAPVETLARGLPIIGPALSAYPELAALPNGVSTLPGGLGEVFNEDEDVAVY